MIHKRRNFVKLIIVKDGPEIPAKTAISKVNLAHNLYLQVSPSNPTLSTAPPCPLTARLFVQRVRREGRVAAVTMVGRHRPQRS